MMKVKIDKDLCSGHGRCERYAPNVFRLDDEGYNADRGQMISVPPGEEKNATLGMKSCPERAITLVEE
jgi:ferredoxin